MAAPRSRSGTRPTRKLGLGRPTFRTASSRPGKTVAELLVDTIVAAGVSRVYGVAGDSLNAITASISARENIRWVPVRHEETAALAAGAETRLTGTLGVAAGSCGPGNLHLVNGLYEAHRSRLPVLAIAAQIPSSEIGTGYFQETHPESIFRECSHYCELVSQAEQMPRAVDIAIRTAIARRGVSVLVLPGDVALRAAARSGAAPRFAAPSPTVVPSDAELAEMARVLDGAEKVTILAGSGCAGAHAELLEVAAKLQAPIVHALGGKEFVEYDNPFDVGMTGLLGFSSGYYAMMQSSALLMLGTDFPYPQFYPTDATILQVDLRGEQLGRRTRVDLGVVGRVDATLRALSPLLHAKTESAHLNASLEKYRTARADLDELAVGTPGKKPIHPQFVARVLDELAAPDAIVACDVGTPTLWAARYLRMNGQRRLLGSFNHGSMATALPQAIGAQLAFPGRQVVTMSGDGGLAMLFGDLLSLHQLDLPVKLVVFNNGALGFVELEMMAAGYVPHATELVNPNFARMADAAGLLGVRVESPEELRPGLTAALGHPGPALVDVVVNRQEVMMPPSIKTEQVAGFGLYLIKAVLSGRGTEVVDLAKTTWFR